MKVDLEQAESLAEFCRLVRERMRKDDKPMSMRLFAEIIGTTAAQVNNVEKGIVKDPVSYCRKLKKYLSYAEIDRMAKLLLED